MKQFNWKNFIFDYNLRIIDENKNFNYEYDGPSFVLKNDIKIIVDQNVAEKLIDSQKNDIENEKIFTKKNIKIF